MVAFCGQFILTRFAIAGGAYRPTGLCASAGCCPAAVCWHCLCCTRRAVALNDVSRGWGDHALRSINRLFPSPISRWTAGWCALILSAWCNCPCSPSGARCSGDPGHAQNCGAGGWPLPIGWLLGHLRVSVDSAGGAFDDHAAGLGWAAYSDHRQGRIPTAGSRSRGTLLMCTVVRCCCCAPTFYTPQGCVGVVAGRASGLGYALWYADVLQSWRRRERRRCATVGCP